MEIATPCKPSKVEELEMFIEDISGDSDYSMSSPFPLIDQNEEDFTKISIYKDNTQDLRELAKQAKINDELVNSAHAFKENLSMCAAAGKFVHVIQLTLCYY